jgi:hypothetical protein
MSCHLGSSFVTENMVVLLYQYIHSDYFFIRQNLPKVAFVKCRQWCLARNTTGPRKTTPLQPF